MTTEDLQTHHATETSTGENDSDLALHSLVSNHPAVADFRLRPSCKQSRRTLLVGEKDLPYNLTCTTLAGQDMICDDPYVFADEETGSILAFYHLGLRLAGHSRIVHGGLSAVLLDECMGRACFPRLVGRIAVTASLELQYKSPIAVDTTILIRATTTKVEGRKAWVEATVENARDGRVCLEAKGLFIEPKWADQMEPVI